MDNRKYRDARFTGSDCRLAVPCRIRPLARCRPGIFLHIPKCGGTTLDFIMAACAQSHGRRYHRFAVGFDPPVWIAPGWTGAWDSVARFAATGAACPDLCSGHFPFGVHDLLDPPRRYVTLVRDPVAREVSSYNFHFQRGFLDGRDSLEQLIATGAMTDNPQTRMLAGRRALYAETCTEDIFEQALANLDASFDLVGIVEKSDEFLAAWLGLQGYPPVAYVNNQVTAVRRITGIDPSLRRILTEHHRWDAALHERCRQRWEAWMAGHAEGMPEPGTLPPETRVLAVLEDYSPGQPVRTLALSELDPKAPRVTAPVRENAGKTEAEAETEALRTGNRRLRVEMLNRHALIARLSDRPPEAEALFAQARGLESAYADWDRARLLLAGGFLAEGWTAWRHRFVDRWVVPRATALPEWQGEPLTGRRLLVWPEQGLGEELMFASLYPDLLERVQREGGRCLIECDPRLTALFARSFPTATIRAVTDPPLADGDCHVAAGSLPQYFRPTLSSFPKRPGFLAADPAGVAGWRERLAVLGAGLKVGVCWRGRRTPSAPLAALPAWAPVLSAAGVHFVSLQYDHDPDELWAIGQRFGQAPAAWPDLDLKDDLDGLAALMTALDRVITAPTAVGDLAGAVGAPVWRHTPVADWAALGTGHRPWFPSLRSFATVADIGRALTR